VIIWRTGTSRIGIKFNKSTSEVGNRVFISDKLSGMRLVADDSHRATALACDGCHRDCRPFLLTPIGEGYLHVCPACLPQALATVRTPNARAAWNPAHLAVVSQTTTAA
jgi:hypothetical protein